MTAVQAPRTPPAPPSDDDGDDDGPRDRALDDLLPPLDDETTHADDDEPLTDPIGVELPSEPDGGADDVVLDLDVGGDADFAEEEVVEQGDDFGIAEPGSDSLEHSEHGSFTGQDDRTGIEDEPAVIREGDLPDLDADDGGLDATLESFGGLSVADDEDLPRVSPPWRATHLAPAPERCGALALGGGAVVAGSSDLLWLDAGRATPVRIALDGTRIASVALLGEERTVALCVTAFGRLLRRGRMKTEVERLTDWRRTAELDGAIESLELCQLENDPSAVIGRLTSGRLVRSDDLGTTFRMIEPTFTALAISPTGDPLAALARDGAALGVSSDGGKTFVERRLVPPASDIAGGEAPLLATAGRVIVIADAERGVAVSNDAGETFESVAGCAGCTAATVGSVGGRATVFLALYRESRDQTCVVELLVADPKPRVIATLEGAGDDSTDGLENGRLERLAWDGSRLSGVGDAGLVRFEPPAGD